MLIHCDISAYYDWAPVPEDVEVTKEDVEKLLVKQMQGGQWHMRVSLATPTTHDANIFELSICQRLATLEMLGRPGSREESVVEILRKSFAHHLDTNHILNIETNDEGPNEALYEQCLTEIGITDSDKVADAMGRYKNSADMGEYLNVVFKTKQNRKNHKNV